MRDWAFFRPTIRKLITFALLSLLWVIPASREAIMKGTWERHNGYPFTFIFLVESTVGGRYSIWISHFLVVSLVADIIILYLISCIVSFVQKKKTWPKITLSTPLSRTQVDAALFRKQNNSAIFQISEFYLFDKVYFSSELIIWISSF
jgi:hypothetical protein